MVGASLCLQGVQLFCFLKHDCLILSNLVETFASVSSWKDNLICHCCWTVVPRRKTFASNLSAQTLLHMLYFAHLLKGPDVFGCTKKPHFFPFPLPFSTSRTGHPPLSVQMCCRILETQNGNELLLSTLDSSSRPFFLRWHRISLWLIKLSGNQSSFLWRWLYQSYSLNCSVVRLCCPFLFGWEFLF